MPSLLTIVSTTFIMVIRVLLGNIDRAALPILSLAVGIAAIMTVQSIGAGAAEAVRTQLSRMGTKVIVVWPAVARSGGVASGQGSAMNLTVQDAVALKRQVPLLTETAWTKGERLQIVYTNRNWSGPVYAVSPGLLAILEYELMSGRPITQDDMIASARVALIGQTVVQNLFDSDQEPLGALLRINNVLFDVIGILSPKGHLASGRDQDDIVMIPFTTAEQKVLAAQRRGIVENIAASTDSPEELPQAAEAVQELLRMRHKIQRGQPDGFRIHTTLDMLTVQQSVSDHVTLMLLALACASLLVAGIGIMNVLLMSVNERTREIGLRMAVGATRCHILIQFLAEAGILGIIGGLFGTVLGMLSAHAITSSAGWPTLVTPRSISLAFLFSLSVALFFAAYPANKASRLHPVDALRHE